jgi:hypothetical protein
MRDSFAEVKSLGMEKIGSRLEEESLPRRRGGAEEDTEKKKEIDLTAEASKSGSCAEVAEKE